MNQQLQVFNHEQFGDVRIIEEDGKVLPQFEAGLTWEYDDIIPQAALRPVWQSAYSAGSELAVSAWMMLPIV